MRFKEKTCIYCLVNPSTPTGDHVFARKFFLEHRRDNLPKVPSCKDCGDKKSRLERYLMERLPFGGRHEDAAVNLSTNIPRRLAKNVRAHRELVGGIVNSWHRERSGLLVRRMSIPVDGKRIEELFRYVTKALMWHHWKVSLGADCFVDAHIPTFALIPKFVALLRAQNAARVHHNVGKGTFIYAGAQGGDNPVNSVWEFAIFGGVELRGGAKPREVVSRIYAITGPLRVKQQAERRMAGAHIIRP